MTKIVMVGMNPRTRAAIPWDSDEKIWTLNEAPAKDWLKRYDVLFQIHPRWDWDRPNNISDPNHPLYIKAQSGQCLYCKGEGKAYNEGKEVPCPFCEYGVYTVPQHREGKTIIMQDMNEDAPGCLKMPLPENPYLTSTLAHMLFYAILHKYESIELYGFEAESGTEYAHQRACIEYWIGYGRGMGMSITAPGSGLLTGKHYAYEDFDQGYRSRLEMRKRTLQENLNAAEVAAVKSEGHLEALTPFQKIKAITPVWEAAYDDHFRKKNMVSFIRGTIKELDNAIAILDGYRLDGDTAKETDVRRLIETHYGLG
ncbi:MAG: hypothetical protein IPP74_15665 [Alphaproteobacteria bacterium]|nr:hypothetical protein [Alphaproteobacteria bacterium]